jgi:hypothetical protein
MSKPRAISSNPLAMPSNHISKALYNMLQSADGPLALAGGCRLGGVFGSRTEAVLLVALRVAAPAERAVRSADRANMLSVSWLGARKEWINGVVDGGDRGGVAGSLLLAKENLGRASQQERICPDWPPDHTTTKSMISALPAHATASSSRSVKLYPTRYTDLHNTSKLVLYLASSVGVTATAT